jgi:hypothetical protein
MLPAVAAAQEAGAARSIRVVVDNDLIAVRGAGAPPDYDYTHGTRITWCAGASTAPNQERTPTTRSPSRCTGSERHRNDS